MTGQTIVDLLRIRGRELLTRPAEHLAFSPEIRRQTDNLRLYPHAYVFASIFDRNIPTRRVAFATLELWRRLGDFSFDAIRRLPLEAVQKAVTQPTKLHRFHGQMAVNIFEAIRLIESRYSGDASRIWLDEPSAAVLIRRFREFRGIGPKIAHMAALILFRDFHVKIRDLDGFDIAPDVHVRRVLWRMGLAVENAEGDQVVILGRELNPEFPGLLDLPLWEVGYTWCHAGGPDCPGCYLHVACPTAGHAGAGRQVPSLKSLPSKRPSGKRSSDPREVRTEHGHETGLQQIESAVRPLAEKLIREVQQVLPGLEMKPTRCYLSLKYHGKLVAALYPRSGGFTLGHYDPPQGTPRGGWVNSPVWRAEDLAALLPTIIERARYLG